jgi:uncharacterized protein
MKLSTNYKILFLILGLTLVAAGCNSNSNTLDRPSPMTSSADSSEPNTNEAAQNQGLPTKNIKINDRELNVEVASTDESRTLGLSNRIRLDEGKGMLFDFTDTSINKPEFWMKDMLMSIDIIWIDKNKIVGIESNTPIPQGQDPLPTYTPPTDITHVLEVPSGWAKKNNVTTGSVVTL